MGRASKQTWQIIEMKKRTDQSLGKEQSFESNERANTPKSHPKNNP
jgi:hypothetical protein